MHFAFYVTFHVDGTQWGIYVPVSSILYLGLLFSTELHADWITCLKLGFRCLHQHELFHFATDYFASQLELLTGDPCSKPAQRLRDAKPGYIVLEEKLAPTFVTIGTNTAGMPTQLVTTNGWATDDAPDPQIEK